jgi:predicted SprT family Zn-dependent metalloprotease
MRIKTFRLLNHRIKVEYKKRIIAPDGSCPYGICYVEKNKIEIATHSPSTGEPLPEDFIQHTLWHEIGHLLMALMNKNDLFADEAFVDGLGSLLAQLDNTRKNA